MFVSREMVDENERDTQSGIDRRHRQRTSPPSLQTQQTGHALASSRMLLCPPRLLDGLTPAMLSIGKLARGQADYYLEQAKGRVDHATSVESGVEDYYLGGPEAKGYWLGCDRRGARPAEARERRRASPGARRRASVDGCGADVWRAESRARLRSDVLGAEERERAVRGRRRAHAGRRSEPRTTGRSRTRSGMSSARRRRGVAVTAGS